MFIQISRWLMVSLFCFCSLAVQANIVDINSANSADISEHLSGIGPKKAAAIVAYRLEHGKFDSLEALLRVKGIGTKTLQINRDNLSLGAQAPESKSNKAADTSAVGIAVVSQKAPN